MPERINLKEERFILLMFSEVSVHGQLALQFLSPDTAKLHSW
jgi:hypothetical protein